MLSTNKREFHKVTVELRLIPWHLLEIPDQFIIEGTLYSMAGLALLFGSVQANFTNGATFIFVFGS